MARKRAAAVGGVAPKLQGKTVALAGKVHDQVRKTMAKFVRAEGGTLAAGVTPSLDYLVILEWRRKGRPAAVKQAEELNRRRGAAIRILSKDEFNQLLYPDRDEAVALLRAGERGVERWNRLSGPGTGTSLDLRGVDLRKADLRGAYIEGARLDGADLRGADLTEAFLPELTGARLDGARLVNTYMPYLKDCTLPRADLTGSAIDPAEYTRCDFTGARLRRVTGPSTQAVECVFKGADLREADLHESEFTRADFSGADLSGADLSKSALRAANFARAKLVRAGLTDADLAGADLRGADLRGAAIDRADFTGANMSGAKLDALA
jgi:uncharacterized protein YjbI with pentapeptide repeats